MTDILLDEHIYVGCTDDQVILLDLKNDAYLALTATQMDVLSRYVPGWPYCGACNATQELRQEAMQEDSKVIEMLLNEGILARDHQRGKDATPVCMPRPEAPVIDTVLIHTLLNDKKYARPVIRIGDVVNFLVANLSAALMLRHWKIAKTVGHVHRRKSRGVQSAGSVSQLSGIDRIRDRVRVFRLLRPFLFAGRDRCMLNSLALVEFLARYDVFPTWVFGVKTGPFGAHCWVQHEGFILNDMPENARRFTPIMAV